MPIFTERDRRREYAKEIINVIPKGTIDFDSLFDLIYNLDKKNHPDSSDDRSNGFATTTLLGIKRALMRSKNKDRYYGYIEMKLNTQDVLPISYLTHEGIKLISECETPTDFYNSLGIDEETRKKAGVRPGIYNSLHHALTDKLKSSE